MPTTDLSMANSAVSIENSWEQKLANGSECHRLFGGSTLLSSVVPQSSKVTFYDKNSKTIAFEEIRFDLVFRDNGDRADQYLAAIWNNDSYRVEIPSKLLAAMVNFVKRGGRSAYIPAAGEMIKELAAREEGLVECKSCKGFIAHEFLESSVGSDLLALHEMARFQPVDNQKEKEIIERNRSSFTVDGPKSGHISADFDIDYAFFLASDSSKFFADIGGIPLQYHWAIDDEGKPILITLKFVAYPEVDSPEYRGIMFFQAVAVLRQLKRLRPTEFEQIRAKLN